MSDAIWKPKERGTGEFAQIAGKRILLSVNDPDATTGPPYTGGVHMRVKVNGPFQSTDTARERTLRVAKRLLMIGLDDIEHLLKEFEK